MDANYSLINRLFSTERAAILDHLEAATCDLLEGNPQRIAILGAKGAGKTSLLMEYMDRLLKNQDQIIPIYMDFQKLAFSLEEFVAGFLGIGFMKREIRVHSPTTIKNMSWNGQSLKQTL